MPQDSHVPACEKLAEAGWLRREVHDDVAFFWTAQAELALDVDELTEAAKGAVN